MGLDNPLFKIVFTVVWLILLLNLSLKIFSKSLLEAPPKPAIFPTACLHKNSFSFSVNLDFLYPLP